MWTHNVTEDIKITNGDAFDVLKQLRAEQRHFDVVILDPPALIKRKKDLRSGTQAYRRLNQYALRVLSKDGILVTCSCSYHLGRDDLLDILRQAALHIDCFLQLLYEGGQAMDHPVLPAMPETRYLKCFVFSYSGCCPACERREQRSLSVRNRNERHIKSRL